MAILENDKVRLAIDERGNLTELVNRETGSNYAGGGMLWRLYFQRGEQMDREILAPDTVPEIAIDADTITLHYPKVNYQGAAMAIAVTVRVKLADDETRWSIELRNNEPDIILRECQFPLVRGLILGGRQELICSRLGGKTIHSIRDAVKNSFTHYVASDHNFLHTDMSYPGQCATNCYVFAGPDEGLYCGCHDETFAHTLHMFRLYGDDLECGFARYPSLATGAALTVDTFVLSPYSGDWHAAARKYRAWADAWFTPPSPPKWVRTMKAWHRIIMKHQYGEVHYRYDQIPEIHDDGLRAGIDALHMFGWWKGGMDNDNPQYTIDETLGGREVLARGIEAFQQDGSVILYANGRLVDVDSDFYRTFGKKVSIKDKFGAEIRDAYRFRANGTFTGHFGNRTFTAACPYCDEWFDKMKEVIDTAVALGCKGVFFDQLGFTEFPCFDKSHGHETPDMRMAWRKAELTRQLTEYARSRNPEMGLGIECITDVSAQHCDFVHSLSGFCDTETDWENTGEKPVLGLFVDWFRYTFPEVIITDREIRDDTDIERRVNHALLKGLRSDVEIYRCRRTIRETPIYEAYLKKANALRERYSDFLLEGRYVDTDGFTIDNDQFEARAFLNGERMAVVVTQSHMDSGNVTVTADGYDFVERSGLGEIRENGSPTRLTLNRHALAVLVFAKQAKD